MIGSRSAGLTDVARLFAGSRLTLARQLAGLKKVQLATRIDKTPTAISAYESGRTRPAPNTVAELCMALGVEPSFFLATPATAQSVLPNVAPHFRSLRSTTQLARDQATAFGAVVHDVISAFERHVDLPIRDVPVHVVDVDSEGSMEPIEAARVLRKSWQLGNGPIGHLLRKTENQGIVSTFSPVQAASLDAYSFETPTRPVVILNPLKGDYFRQRFDLAHELGHIVMHADVEPGSRVVEGQANRFASEFLMPADEVMPSLPRRLNWPQLQELKEYWGVSLQALLFRARDLGAIGDVTYRNAMMRMSKEGWRRREPGTHPNVEQPSLLPRAKQLLEEAGVTSAEIAAEARAPMNLFRIITARVPEVVETSAVSSGDHLLPETGTLGVVSLLK